MNMNSFFESYQIHEPNQKQYFETKFMIKNLTAYKVI